MFIINRYTVNSTPVALTATNDTNVNTGNQSPIWIGDNPTALGATGNPGNNTGLTNITTVGVYTDQVIAKLVAINVTNNLLAGQDNYIRVPLSQLSIANPKAILGAVVVGVYDPNSNEGTAAPTPSMINVNNASAQCLVSVVRDALVLKIINNQQALFQGKVANIFLIYN